MEKKGNMTAANMNAIHDITQLVKEDCLKVNRNSDENCILFVCCI